MNRAEILQIVIIVAAVALIVLLFAICLIAAFSPTIDNVEWNEEIYIVESGDTLWGIATKHCPKNVDYREWIKAVREINGLSDCKICRGDMLTVLVPKD